MIPPRRVTRRSAQLTAASQTPPILEDSTPAMPVEKSHQRPAKKNNKNLEPVVEAQIPTSNVSEPCSIPHERQLHPSNNPHPANAAGLYKRTQAEISKDAALKRTVKEARLKELEAQVEERRHLQEEGARELAALEDERRREELLEEAELQRYIPVDPDHHDCAEGEEVDTRDGGHIDAVTNHSDETVSTVAPKKSARDKRQEQVLEIRTTIADNRKTQVGGTKGMKHAHLSLEGEVESSSRSAAKRTKTPATMSAFDPAWLQGQANVQKSAGTKPMSIQAATTTTETRGNSSRNAVPGSAFADEDVMAVRPSEVNMSRLAGHKGRSKQLVKVVSGSQLPEQAVLSLGMTAPVESFQAKKQFKIEVDSPSRTRGQDQLPAWVTSKYKTSLLPTLIDFFGLQEDLWDLNGYDGDVFVHILRIVANELYPTQFYEPTKGGDDKLYTLARQAVGDARRKIQTRALKMVKAHIQQATNNNVIAVRAYVERAIKKSNGAAFWAEPDPKDPRYAFQSEFIAAGLAEHVRDTRGSILPEHGQFPAGAFILSVIASLRAFKMHSTGVYIAGKAFSAANMSVTHSEWYKSYSIQQFLSKPHRQDELMARVKVHVAQLDGTQHITPQASSPDESDDDMIVDCSSPPPTYDST
ncbi:hypothetical protein DENSPDRAFT_850739 [Dentipellis sp. KUC8613]|nr:hypothetical protein DENSPDRAFT_850739 [Dentipellis sp. KUC8613]